MDPLEKIRLALTCGEASCTCAQPRGHVHCPAHEDKTPSLSISEKNGKVLFKCFGGCPQAAVLEALKARNLWPPGEGERPPGQDPAGLTLEQLAQAKRLPVESLKKWGVGTLDYKGRPAVHIPYRDLAGKVTSRFRLNLTREPRLIWRKGSKTLLYGLWRLSEFKDGWLLLVEGESDCWTAWNFGIPALALPGKTNWKSEWAVHLERYKVYLWVEPDAPELPGKLARDLPGLLVIKAPPGAKDISEAHIKGQDVVALITELKAKAGAPSKAVPEIIITKRFLHHKSNQALQALEAVNSPPFIFRRSGTLARVSLDETNTPRIENYSDLSLRGALARAANFFKEGPKGLSPTSPPKEIPQDILTLGSWPSFPALDGLATCPIMRPDGSIWGGPGYDPVTRLYHVSPSDLVPAVPDKPIAQDMQNSLDYLLEIIQDFPFCEDSDRAGALALIFTLPLRPAIPGLLPLAAITSPAPGTGKTLLADVVALIGTGKVAPMAGFPRDDDELRKSITARLLSGDPLICFDNVEAPLRASSLSRALTCTTWEDRILGQSATVHLPQRAIWLVTGNNLQLRGDLPRRTFPVRIDAKLAKPWERENFKHRDLCAWVRRYRGDFLAAIFTIARAWFVAGKPEPRQPVPVMGGFEAWTSTIGGILSFAGVNGFLENLTTFHDQADLEGPEWEAFLTAWIEMIGDKGRTCQEVSTILRDNSEFAATLPDNLQDILKDPERSFEKSLGRALARKEKRPYGENNVALQRVGSDKRAILWLVGPLKSG